MQQNTNNPSHPNDGVTTKGVVHFQLYGADGKLKQDKTVNNLIVNTGKAHIASRLISNTGLTTYFMAIGIGTTDPAVGQTTLISQVGTRVSATATQGTSPSDNKVTFAAEFAPQNPPSTAALVEAGIFTASSGGTMLNRVKFAEINKEAGDTLVVSWDVTIN